MSEEPNVAADERVIDVWNVDEFYVRRINWLVELGRSDLIDEIADDCERSRAGPRHTTADRRPGPKATATCSLPAAR